MKPIWRSLKVHSRLLLATTNSLYGVFHSAYRSDDSIRSDVWCQFGRPCDALHRRCSTQLARCMSLIIQLVVPSCSRVFLLSNTVYPQHTETGQIFATYSSLRAGSVPSASEHLCRTTEIHAEGSGGALRSPFAQSDHFDARLFDAAFKVPEIVARQFREFRNCDWIVSATPFQMRFNDLCECFPRIGRLARWWWVPPGNLLHRPLVPDRF